MNDFLALTVIVARVALAVVFLVAAAAKLRDRAGARQAVADFGLPSALVGPIAQLLPYSEIVLALGLIPAATAWWAAAGIFLMLVGFTVGMVVNLVRGRKPACHCFGEMDAEPIGWHSLIRNGVLGLIALVIVVLGFGVSGAELIDAPALLARVMGLSDAGALIVLVAIVGLLIEAFYVSRLRDQNAALTLRLSALEENVRTGKRGVEPAAEPTVGLRIGATAPTFRLNDLTGKSITLEALRAQGNSVLLMFTDPNCGPCQRLMPDLGLWQGEYGEDITIALVSRGTVEANLAKTSEFGVTNVMLQKDHEVREAYKVKATPSAVIIRPDGTIGSETAAGAEAITVLATQALNQAVQVQRPQNSTSTSTRLPVGA